MYSKMLTFYDHPVGSQPFEYYGASLTSLDMNGDGFDELIVGSPLYSKRASTSSSVCFQN